MGFQRDFRMALMNPLDKVMDDVTDCWTGLRLVLLMVVLEKLLVLFFGHSMPFANKLPKGVLVASICSMNALKAFVALVVIDPFCILIDI